MSKRKKEQTQKAADNIKTSETFFKPDERGSTIERVSPSLSEGFPQLGFKRLSEDATIPTKAHATDSGFDLFAAEDVIIDPGETKVVKTDIAVQLPEGMEAQVRPRSGITSVGFIQIHLGTIDNSYRGNIGIIVENKKFHEYKTADNRVPLDVKGALIMDNDGTLYMTDEIIFSKSCLVRKGDKIAQLVVQRLPQVEAVEIDSLEESERGEGGFGSTDV